MSLSYSGFSEIIPTKGRKSLEEIKNIVRVSTDKKNRTCVYVGSDLIDYLNLKKGEISSVFYKEEDKILLIKKSNSSLGFVTPKTIGKVTCFSIKIPNISGKVILQEVLFEKYIEQGDTLVPYMEDNKKHNEGKTNRVLLVDLHDLKFQKTQQEEELNFS